MLITYRQNKTRSFSADSIDAQADGQYVEDCENQMQIEDGMVHLLLRFRQEQAIDVIIEVARVGLQVNGKRRLVTIENLNLRISN